MTIEELREHNVAILGLGIEGLATAQYFLKHNITFSVLDEKSEDSLQRVGEEWKQILKILKENYTPLFLGSPLTSEMLTKYSVVVRSPGINSNKSYIKDFAGEKTSSIKLFFDNCPGKIVGVTGTKGKGTTSSLIYEMLKKGGFDAYLGGNIGKPPISFLDTLTPQSICVLELSSFQLMDLKKSPHIAVMLMVTSEHLDYHSSREEYILAKQNILAWQTVDDMAVLNIDYPATKSSSAKTLAKVVWASRYSEVEVGSFVRNGKIILRVNEEDTKILSVNSEQNLLKSNVQNPKSTFEYEVINTSEILLPGGHNLENICAATTAAYGAGVSIDDIAFVLRTFKGLEHRLELVREFEGVRYYDDSFSTVPETAIAAIQAFKEPEIIILGGSSKNSDFTALGETISKAENIKAIIGIGVEWPKIKLKIKNEKLKIIENLKTMEEIVKTAKSLSKPGDVVILSPACASFDMFKNYKDRGNQFKHYVNQL